MKSKMKLGAFTALFAIIGLVSGVAHGAGAASNEEAGAEQAVTPQAGDIQTATVEDVMDNTDNYLDKKVTLKGEVDEVFGNNAFNLEGDGFLFEDEILVVSPKAAAGRQPASLEGLSDDDKVQVTGTVRRAARIDIERDYGWDLNPELEAEYEGTRTVLILDSINRTPAGNK